jgi:hypothetical protein
LSASKDSREARRPEAQASASPRHRLQQGECGRLCANVLPVIEQIKASGVTSLRAIAKALNARGVATARGGVWTPVQVTAVILHTQQL